MPAISRRKLLATALTSSITTIISGCSETQDPPSLTRSNPATSVPGTPPPTRSPSPTPTPEPPKSPVSCDDCEPPFLRVPPGFNIGIYADSGELGGGKWQPGPEPGPRLMATYQGTLYATIPSQGRVVALPSTKNGQRAAKVMTVVDDLDRPHGISFDSTQLYLALENDIRRYEMQGLVADPDSLDILVDDIPSGGFHWSRTIVIHEGHIYLAAGDCQPAGAGGCEEGNQAYLAAITRFDLDGLNPTTYATGLRNAVGMTWYDGHLFATENGVDGLGADVPPDEINIVEFGGDYGHPNCIGQNTPVSTDTGKSNQCSGRIGPTAVLPAHSAPLGLDAYTADRFPRGYQKHLYVALHGSWARPNPVGYKVVRVPYVDGTLRSPQDFAVGWMPDGGDDKDALGRPVDVHTGTDGALYLSDDMRGTIYRISYEGE